jgi:hypothetical protein
MMKIGVSSASGQIDPNVFAELVSRRWQEARSYYTLNRMLEASWRRRPVRSVLELRWSRRAPLQIKRAHGAITRCEPRLVHAIAGAHGIAPATCLSRYKKRT